MSYRITIKPVEGLLAAGTMDPESAERCANRVYENFELLTEGCYAGGYKGIDHDGDGAIFLEDEISEWSKM